jgi:hypothetical protein
VQVVLVENIIQEMVATEQIRYFRHLLLLVVVVVVLDFRHVVLMEVLVVLVVQHQVIQEMQD